MFQQVKKIFGVLAEDTELFAITAKIYYNMYQAMIGVGFTDDQAMKIVCSHSVVPNSKKAGHSEI